MATLPIIPNPIFGHHPQQVAVASPFQAVLACHSWPYPFLVNTPPTHHPAPNAFEAAPCPIRHSLCWCGIFFYSILWVSWFLADGLVVVVALPFCCFWPLSLIGWCIESRNIHLKPLTEHHRAERLQLPHALHSLHILIRQPTSDRVRLLRHHRQDGGEFRLCGIGVGFRRDFQDAGVGGRIWR